MARWVTWAWVCAALVAVCAARAAAPATDSGSGEASRSEASRSEESSGEESSGELEGEGFPEIYVNVSPIGVVRGFTQPTNRSTRQVHSFLGIPFVEKPLRFEPPVEFGKWTKEHLDGRVRRRACPQGKFYPEELESNNNAGDSEGEGDAAAMAALLGHRAVWDWALAERTDTEVPDDVAEDCLTLDVYTPDGANLNASKDDSNLLPVLLFYHGGAFVRGSSWNARPDFIMDHAGEEGRFVMVSAQYRLGPLGFLAGGGTTKAGRGNAGLHDQYWALKWTREYVSAFGGNPENIVIGGVSAGGATSGLLYVSPKTNDLIQGALLFSGCSLSPFAMDTEPRRSSRGVAWHAGCEAESDAAAEAEEAEARGEKTREEKLAVEDELVACLKAAPVENLLNATWDWAREEKKKGRAGMGGTIPVLDGDDDDSLLPRLPVEILTDFNNTFVPKPIVVGITREEGLYLYVQIYSFYLEENKKLTDTYHLSKEFGDVMLVFAGVEDHLNVLGYSVQELYFHDGQLGNISLMVNGIIDFTGSGFFKAPAHLMAQLNADRGANAWLYTFDYVAEQERAAARAANRNPRSNHGSDQIYLFPARDEEFRYAEDDLEMTREFSRMVVDFVRTRNPTPGGSMEVEGAEWPPLTRDDDVYLAITQDGWETRRGFWHEYHATNAASALATLPAVAAATAAALAVAAFGRARL